MLDRAVPGVSGDLTRMKLPAEARSPQHVERRLVVLHLARRHYRRQDDPRLAAVHHVVRAVAVPRAAVVRPQRGGVRIGGAGSEIRRPPVGAALQRAIGTPVSPIQSCRAAARSAESAHAASVKVTGLGAGGVFASARLPASAFSSAKSRARWASTANLGRKELIAALAATLVESIYGSSPQTSPAARHRTTIASKKRRKTASPYRWRMRVKLEWSGSVQQKPTCPSAPFASRARGITPRIARRGIESSERLGRHRWVVERGFSWLLGCRRLGVRYERRADLLEGLLQLVYALICLKFLDSGGDR